MRENNILNCQHMVVITFAVLMLCNTLLTAGENPRLQDVIHDATQQVKEISSGDWKSRADIVTNLRHIRSCAIEAFDTDREVLEALWNILEQDVVLIKENPDILHQNGTYRQYFEDLVHLISLNQKRSGKYALHTVLVQLPEWYEETVRVIATEGGQDILPQLLQKLSSPSSGKQDLRDGILMMTYINIAQGKYPPKSVQVLKRTYLHFLSDKAFNAADSLAIKSRLRKHAIRGLGVIGDKNTIADIKPFLSDPYYKKDTFYDPQTGFTKRQKGMQYYPVREEAKRVLDVLERGEKLSLQEILPRED